MPSFIIQYFINDEMDFLMLRKQLTAISLAIALTLGYSGAVYADTLSTSTVVMENCGAYLFEWRPVGYDNGKYFAILVWGAPYQKAM